MSSDDISTTFVVHKDQKAERNGREPPLSPVEESKDDTQYANYLNKL